MLVLAVSYIVVTTATRRESPLSPAQFAVPSVHYHLPSPQALTPLRTEASTTAATVVAATKTSEETTSEVNEQKELRLASRSTMDDPVSRPWLSNEAGAADATTNNETETEFGTSTPVLGLLEYPETQFPAYKPSPSMSAEPATVRLDGKIQQFKRGPK
jgi:hypothetical protein